MDSAVWICVFLPLFFAIFVADEEHRKLLKRKKLFIMKDFIKRERKCGVKMSEVIKRFIGKECIITTMNENVNGVIEALEDNWVIVSPSKKNPDSKEIIKVDYISRIREYPRNKKS